LPVSETTKKQITNIQTPSRELHAADAADADLWHSGIEQQLTEADSEILSLEQSHAEVSHLFSIAQTAESRIVPESPEIARQRSREAATAADSSDDDAPMVSRPAPAPPPPLPASVPLPSLRSSPRVLPDPASSASVPASLWPPALSQQHARQQLFAMVTVEGQNGNYRVAIEDVPAFVALVHTLVHPSVRSHAAGFTEERVKANVRYLNE
jgi:hypothetical protein